MNPMVVRATAVLAGHPHNDDGHEDLRRLGLDVDSGMAANGTCLCHGPLRIGMPPDAGPCVGVHTPMES